MAGLFKIAEIEARKRGLVAETEVYRETLRLEVQNLRLYSMRLRKKLAFFSALQPVALFAVPAIISRLRGRRRPAKRRSFVANVLLGFRLYRRFGPMILQMIQSRRGASGSGSDAEEANVPAANI